MKWMEIDQDNLQTGAAKAVARLMSFAQIICFAFHQSLPAIFINACYH